MNGRILQLLQQPQQISSEDLQLLSREIQRYPYAQALKALHLLGTSKYAPEQYQKELTTAAAYTTDKKVLYHLVHGRKFQEETQPQQLDGQEEAPPRDVAEDASVAEDKNLQESAEENTAIITTEEKSQSLSGDTDLPEDKEESSTIATTEEKSQSPLGDPNLQESPKDSETINTTEEDPTSPLEQEMVDEKPEAEESLANSAESEEKDEVKPLESDNSFTEEGSEESEDINFYQTADLPLATVPASGSEENFKPQQVEEISTSKIEQARLDLIAEVERKMAEKKRREEEMKSAETSEKSEQPTQQPDSSLPEAADVSTEEKPTEWQPLQTENPKSFRQNVGLKDQTEVAAQETTKEEAPEIKDGEPAPPEEQETNAAVEPEETEAPEDTTAQVPKSNVPGFFSTWMNWLNLDRTVAEPKPQIKKIPEEKLDVIDKFIAAEPKITPVRGEDNSGKASDKKDNIMHLMTDTLANLYVEQRLYGKAIQAYEHLSQKYPERKESYAGLIAKIQEMRNPSGN